jgi:hypothetical protein
LCWNTLLSNSGCLSDLIEKMAELQLEIWYKKPVWFMGSVQAAATSGKRPEGAKGVETAPREKFFIRDDKTTDRKDKCEASRARSLSRGRKR